MKDLAEKILDELNANGAELGNKSTVVINKVLKEHFTLKVYNEVEDGVTVTRGEAKDKHSTKLTVEIVKDGSVYSASGHINNVMNFVSLSADEEADKTGMEKAGIDLEKIVLDIENSEITIK